MNEHAPESAPAVSATADCAHALAAIAAVSRTLLGSTGPEAFAGVLRVIGEALGADRAYIFDNFTGADGALYARQQHEWVAPGIAPQIGNALLQEFPYADFPFLARAQGQQGASEVFVGLVQEMPPAERDMLTAQDIQALMVAPIASETQWFGFVGVDACRAARRWSAEDQAFLQAAAGVIGSARERGRSERRSAETLRRVVEAMPAAVYAVDAEGRITFFNHAAREMWGRTPALHSAADVMCGSFRLYRTTGEPVPHLDTPMADTLRTGRAYRNVEVNVERPDGGRFSALVNINPLLGERGEVIGAVNAFTDITEMRRAEEALASQAQQLRLLADGAKDIIYRLRFHPEPAFEYISPSAERVTGYSTEEHYGNPFLTQNLIHPDDLHASNAMLADPGCAEHVMTQRWRHKDGRLLWMETQARFIRDEAGRPLAVEGIARDVTAAQETLDALRASEQRYRSLTEQASDGICVIGLDGLFVEVSDEACRLFGRTRAELLGGLPYAALVAPHALDETPLLFEEIRPGEIRRFVREYLRRDGSAFLAEVSMSLVGKTLVHTVIRDVTAQKQALRELRRFRRAVECAGDGFVIQEAATNHLYFNPAFLEMVGYSAEELEAAGPALIFKTPEIIGELQRAVMRRESWQGEVEVRRRDGREILVLLRVNPLLGDDGALAGYVCSHTDITERRRVEREALLARERLALACASAEMGAWEYDCLADRLHLTEEAEALLGLAPGAFAGGLQTFLDRLYPQDRENSHATIKQLLASGEDFALDFRAVLDSGAVVWLMVKGAVHRAADGAPLRLSGIVMDVTQRRRVEAALQESKDRWRRLVEHSPLPIIIIQDDRLHYANAAAARLVDAADPAQIIGRSVSDFLIPAYEAAYVRNRDLWSMDLTSTEPHTYGIRCFDGEKRMVEVVGVPTVLEGRMALQVILRDVTAERAHEEALVEARRRAEEMAQLKDSFLANMSHEIRTPLTAIIGFTDVLEEEVPEPAREFVDLIRSSGRRLMDTLNSVLDLAQIRSGGMQLQQNVVDVVEHARLAARLFAGRAAQSGVELRLDTRGCEALEVLADGRALDRILNNLVSNAVKFTREGRITVGVGFEGPHVVLQVADTGIGISPEFLPHIFDEFRQESTGHSRGFEGSGLGMSITRQLVELMGGEICVESEQGRGAVVTVRLPRTEGAPPEVEDAFVFPAAQPGAGARVLVVEDDPHTQMLARHLLSKRCRVDVAASAGEALACADAHTYDAILMDINLGAGESGEDVMRTLRSNGAAATPIYAMTAYALPGDRARFLDAGFTGYISKPFRRDDLYAVLDAVCKAGGAL